MKNNKRRGISNNKVVVGGSSSIEGELVIKQPKITQWWVDATECNPERMLSPDSWGWTQLMESVALLNYEQAQYLVEVQQVDINVITNDTHEDNALFALFLNNFFARPEKVIKICTLLLDNGINLHYRNKMGLNVLEMIEMLTMQETASIKKRSRLDCSDQQDKLNLLFELKTLVQDRMM